jgi:formylglycine-generating enzyme required for sulfatase activity
MSYAGDFTIKGERNAPDLDGIAWYGGNSSQGYEDRRWSTSKWPEKQYPGGNAGPRLVGQKEANSWGLQDMLGNVWEWTGGWYGAYPTGDVVDPRGAAASESRMKRGGSWFDFAANCRAAQRGTSSQGSRGISVGFRPALVPSK